MSCPVCQCRFENTNCIHFLGDGQQDSPLRPHVRTRMGNNEMAQCGPRGLGVFLRPPWNDIPSVRAYSTITQTFISGALQVLFFDTTDYDTNSMHDSQDETSRITFNTPGLYVVTFSFTVRREEPSTGGATDFVEGAIRMNGFRFLAKSIGEKGNSPLGPYSVSMGHQAEFNQGDYIEGIVEGWGLPLNSQLAIQTSPIASFSANFIRELP